MFDPRAYCQEHGDLKVDEYRLDEAELRKYAIKISKIRRKIMEKSEAIKVEDTEFVDRSSSSNAKASRIYSTSARSSDGLSEHERKHLETLDVIPCGKYKKRCLKQLSVDEQRDIIHAHLAEYESQDYVARRFRISVGLVHRICSAMKKDNTILQRRVEEAIIQKDIQDKVYSITEDMLQ